MKTKRFVSTLLALLLICSLPVSAFADTTENTGPMENNDSPLNVNASTGTITNNNDYVLLNYGSITNNCEGGEVDNNNGAVGTNDGDIVDNGINDHGGTVGINNGQVKRNNEFSTVTTNNGKVTINNGTVSTNSGTVTTNHTTGTVSNIGGTVKTNYGTVNKLEFDSNVSDFFITETWYGVLVDNDGTKTLEEYCEPNKVLDLTQFTKEGYELTGYTQAYGMENGKVTLLPSPITESGTSYTVTCPNVLTLILQAIVSPGSGEIAAAASDGTGSFGPGSVISINGHKFLLVAVVEDVYCLASVESFEDEALSDLPALLASLLTEEQLTHVTGDPELLDEELTARFFAGQGSHIVFPCDSSLIFS